MNNSRLNIGCGPSGINGWLNYDWGILPLLSKLGLIRQLLVNFKILPREYNVKWPSIKLVDIRKKFPLKDNAIQHIYCSHVLEHFERWEALQILKECRRVLRRRGVIRIVIPDIKKICQIYYKSVSRPGRELCRLWWGFDKDEKPQGLIQSLARRFIRDHYWNYDQKELEILLSEAGFSQIKLSDFQKGKFPDINSLDLESHRNYSLYLEASKS
jgi:predicted SAM-dependent methyltransferase